MRKYNPVRGQSVYDVCVQLFGSLEGMQEIVEQMDSIDEMVTQPIEVSETTNYIAINVFKNKICATFEDEPGSIPDNALATDDLFILMTDDGDVLTID